MSSPVPAAPDFSKLARRPSERLAIVEYVRDTPNLQETDCLEWKSAYDLSKRTGAAATSKHLIGFANRGFPQAARHAAGYAYLLLGVETGNLPGVPLWDSADIENWLVRFVGHDLRYDPHYVQADGKQVLFLLVDPPQQGDPIYCLQAQSSDPDGKTLREGSIYVRRNGLTEPASAADIARLGRRAGATTTELDLCVDLDASETCAIEAGGLWDETRDSYIKKERRRLYSGLPNPREQQIGMLTTDFMEKRTMSEFQAEVEAYAVALRDNWFAVHATHHVEAEESELVPILVNDTSSNFEDVVLELTLPIKDIYVYLKPEDARASGSRSRSRPTLRSAWQGRHRRSGADGRRC